MKDKITLKELRAQLTEEAGAYAALPTGAAAADMFANSFSNAENFRKWAGNTEYMKQLGADSEFLDRFSDIGKNDSTFNNNLNALFMNSKEDAELMGSLGIGPKGGIKIDKDGTHHIRQLDSDGNPTDVIVPWSVPQKPDAVANTSIPSLPATPVTSPNIGSPATSPNVGSPATSPAVSESESGFERRTEPFFFNHAVLLQTPVHIDSPDAYGRRLEKVYDKVLIYTTPSTSPYYMWTQLGHGRAVVDRLMKNYKGKWVTAKLKFDGGTTSRISSVGLQVVTELNKDEPKTMFPNVKPPEQKQDKPEDDEPVQMELFESGRSGRKITMPQLKQFILEGISLDYKQDFERDIAKVKRAVEKFNAIRRQAVERMGTEDSLYLETGSTYERPPSYISEMEVEVTPYQVRVSWEAQEEVGWKLVTTADSEFTWRDKNGTFDPDVLLDTVNFKIRGVKKAIRYWEKVNPDNEEQVRAELERDDD